MKANLEKPLVAFLTHVLERPGRVPNSDEPSDLGEIFGRGALSFAGAAALAAVLTWAVKSLT